MNETQRNTRTLIVSFVVAIMALVPLRFLEIGNQQYTMGDSVVLGDQIEASSPDWVKMEESEEVATIENELAPLFEAPYAQIEESGCMNASVVEAKSTALIEEIDLGNLSDNQIRENLAKIDQLQTLVCEVN
ncbi:MAG: hypothetical protein WCT01_05000 [Candidatus Shapirobacteria bacterium]|jgi:hypothetical protein